MHRPFTLYKETTKSGSIWYARFWDETAKKYKYSRSTGIKVEGKKERKYEAEEAARKLLLEITQLQAVSVQKQNSKTADTPLIEYLTNFWTEESEYARFKRNVEKKPLSSNYINMNHEDIRRHVEPFPEFAGITLGELNKAILKKYLIWLAGRRKQTKKKDGTITLGDTISSRRANSILQTFRVAVRWAVDNEELDKDPFRNLGDVTESMKEKGVLTLEERNKLINSPVKNSKTRLFMLLGCLCGMRRGEIRGLQWGDIEGDVINIRHNYIEDMPRKGTQRLSDFMRPIIFVWHSIVNSRMLANSSLKFMGKPPKTIKTSVSTPDIRAWEGEYLAVCSTILRQPKKNCQIQDDWNQ